jgi:hypothetical protein
MDRDGFASLRDMIDMEYTIWKQDEHVHLIVGPHCSPGMIPVAQLAVKYNVPIIGYESIASELLENRATTYATLSRVSQYGSQQGKREEFFPIEGQQLPSWILSSSIIQWLITDFQPSRRYTCANTLDGIKWR